MEDKTTYRFVYCFECGRDFIVPRFDALTGREIPREDFYKCVECERREEKERQQQEKQALDDWREKVNGIMLVNYADDFIEQMNKCKRGHIIPCKICKAVYGGCENEQ